MVEDGKGGEPARGGDVCWEKSPKGHGGRSDECGSRLGCGARLQQQRTGGHGDENTEGMEVQKRGGGDRFRKRDAES